MCWDIWFRWIIICIKLSRFILKNKDIVLNDEHGGTQFIVTNLSLPQKDIVRVYRKLAAIEDIIRELKGGFAFGKTDSSSFFANKARMWISVIASNLMRLMKSIALYDQQQSWTINTFRDRLLKIGGRVSLSTPARWFWR